MIFSVDVISIVAICGAITLISMFKLIIKWLDNDIDKDIEKLKAKGENNG